MNKIFSLFVPAMLLVQPVLAQFKDPVDLAIEKDLVDIRDWKEHSDTRWQIEIKGRSGALLYFGAQHMDDPENIQFRDIREAFKRFKPSVVLYEGPDRGEAAGEEETIRKFGESGYIRWLAKQEGIPIDGLEPDFKKTYNYLTSKFGQYATDIYMLSKEAMRLRTRKSLDKDALISQTEAMMKQVPAMIGRPLSVSSISELAAGFKKLTSSGFEWWEAPANWYDPAGNSALLTNQISAASSAYRNIYMVRIISEYARKGQRVFAVVGRNHVPLQEAAIRKRIE